MEKPSLNAIFRPRSVAVIGASNRPNSIGREIVHNLIEYEFQGPVFPVNPNLRTLHSLKVYPTVLDIPDPVDLAVIVVPKEAVIPVAESCARKGVAGLVVISAGFKEVGRAGEERERRLEALVRRSGMRMVGPNCMGVINTDPEIRLDASFARTLPSHGNIGFMSQSGALGEAILSIAHRKGIGFSMFVSVGNKTDVSGNDLLLYWENDPSTSVILLYLESFGDPRRFTEIARRLSRSKPILAVKAGRTSAGARAVSSHTGALAGRDMAVDLMFEQCGVIRATSIEDLFDLAPAFSMLPPPEGPRVGIITNAGGPGILATDACVALGLVVEPASEGTRASLQGRLSPDASLENPLDLLAGATPADYRLAIQAGLADPNFDALIIVFVPPVMTRSEEVAQVICDEGRTGAKPVLVCFMGADEGVPGVDRLRAAGFPVYGFPESAARALAALASYGQWRRRAPGSIVTFDVDAPAVRSILDHAAASGREWLTGPEARRIVQAYGIRVARGRQVTSPGGLREAAGEIGYPVVLKLDGSSGIHKTDSSGVHPGLRNEEEARQAWGRLEGAGQPVLVQEMIVGARELIVGMSQDPVAGALVMVGMGGVFVELLRDVCFRIHPISRTESAEMIQSLRGYPILKGYRGEKGIEMKDLEECLLRVSQLGGDFPEIQELEINPFMAVAGGGSAAVDVRVRIRFPVETRD